MLFYLLPPLARVNTGRCVLKAGGGREKALRWRSREHANILASCKERGHRRHVRIRAVTARLSIQREGIKVDLYPQKTVAFAPSQNRCRTCRYQLEALNFRTLV